MLHDFMETYIRQSKIKGISISDKLFHKGVSDEQYGTDESLLSLLNEKFVFYGFRYVPDFMLSNKSKFLNKRAIVLVRDPRDCVVSAYYSFLKSHVIPSEFESDAAKLVREERKLHQTSSIDDYALSEIHRFVEELCGYAYFAHENLRIFRYEDIIFNKRDFFRKVVNHLGLHWNNESFEFAVQTVDIIPDKERPDQHIRNVRPGNYKEKLRKSTIHLISQHYGQVLALYGYDH